jgi:tRNA-binding protein
VRHSKAFRARLTSAEDTDHLPPPPFQERDVDQITWDDFAKVDIRVGRIVQAEDFPQARKPAYRLKIDFGELGVKASSAQITKYYRREELVGRQVLAVVNFPPRQIANFFSEVLTLGVVQGEGDIVLIGPDREVPLGGRIA